MADMKDPTIRKAVKDYVDEMSASMSRSEGERDFQKEATSLLAEKYELDKKIIKKMARVYHRSNFQTTKADEEAFQETYISVYGDQR